jgi:UDP-GlcNAc3NAcA epimerase
VKAKLLSVVGARPQFIKAAAVTRAISAVPDLHEVMVHTGQHFDADMSAVFFEELDIPEPAYNLGIGGGRHGEMTGRMMEALEKVVIAESPALVLVYGDTNSTLAGALCAAKLDIPVAHVEAGLRSFNRAMPEEINRIVADHVSTLLLCPTRGAVANLHAEGITAGVHHTGDVMYDATLHARARAMARSRIIEQLDLADGGYAVATVHRAENTDTAERLAAALEWLRGAAARRPVVLPLHPRTRLAAQRFGLSFDGLTVCGPLGYLDMARLLAGAVEVYTDSGGLQKEAYFYRKPCVTLRGETEWTETIDCGWNRLWHVPAFALRRDIDDYGDGRAAVAVVELLAERVGGRA